VNGACGPKPVSFPAVKIGVARETAEGEGRVALVPEVIARLKPAGIEVLVEEGAGAAAHLPDGAYAAAGAMIVSTAQLYEQAEIVVRVQKPSEAEMRRLHKGQALIGFIQPLIDPRSAASLAERGVTAVSLDTVPRISRAQTMDALSSQANVAGYKAALIGATSLGKYFPLLMTAAGTAPPAKVLVLGAGVAGLQAIATARRLGAVVSAYDVRAEVREQVESLGATFVVLKSVADASGTGGYARALTEEEQRAQRQELNAFMAEADVIITTALVPGRRAPILVDEDAVKAMRPGAVVVDLAGEQGGNCALSKSGETIETDNGVIVAAPLNLPSSMATSASLMYARNMSALLLHLVKEGKLVLDFDDEITAGAVITHDGTVVHPATKKLLEPASATPAQPAPATRAAAS
jgi:NAD(P) transhydrogenase subunit alpha